MRSELPGADELTVDTYTSSAAYPGGFFDIPALASSVDGFFVMAYDMDNSNWQYAPLTCASYCFSPTAPLTTYYYNDTTAMQQYVQVVPPSKVILGVPYYGYTACVASQSESRPVSNAIVPQAAPLGWGGPAPWPDWSVPTYLDSIATQQTPGVSAFASGNDQYDRQGEEPYGTWESSTYDCWRESYWDDTTSLAQKYDLVNQDNLRGVGIFALDYGGGNAGSPALWNELGSHFFAPYVTSLSPSTGSFTGGTTVTIDGGNFRSGEDSVQFGANPAEAVTVVSASEITAIAPPGYGTVNVSVIDVGDGGVGVAQSAFTYGTAPYVQYFSWFDRISSPGFVGDNIHVVNPDSRETTVVVDIPGQPGCTPYSDIPAGSEEVFTCPTGFGGPVTVSSDQPVLTSQRVEYYESFNEVEGEPASAAQTTLYFSWFDRISSPGFVGDNIHVVDPGTTAANVTVDIPGQPACTRTGTIPAGGEEYFTCPTGFGGPVVVTSDQPVLASQRVQYYQSFNEVKGMVP
jgi:hypothetical protein